MLVPLIDKDAAVALAARGWRPVNGRQSVSFVEGGVLRGAGYESVCKTLAEAQWLQHCTARNLCADLKVFTGNTAPLVTAGWAYFRGSFASSIMTLNMREARTMIPRSRTGGVIGICESNDGGTSVAPK